MAWLAPYGGCGIKFRSLEKADEKREADLKDIISGLSERIVAIEGNSTTLTEIKESITKLTNSIDSVKNDLSKLKTDIVTKRAEVKEGAYKELNDLKQRVTHLEAKQNGKK